MTKARKVRLVSPIRQGRYVVTGLEWPHNAVKHGHCAGSSVVGNATFGGSTIEVKDEINQLEYGPKIHVRDILEGRVEVPPTTQRLYILLNGQR